MHSRSPLSRRFIVLLAPLMIVYDHSGAHAQRLPISVFPGNPDCGSRHVLVGNRA